jgi:hypothetical protein
MTPEEILQITESSVQGDIYVNTMGIIEAVSPLITIGIYSNIMLINRSISA